jgi:hypothetical protein
MSEPIKQMHRDIEIMLLEDENVWQFTVNGRQRKAPTLPKAREYIDNALDRIETKKEKPWEPIDAYFLDSYPNSLGNLQKGKITSVAGRDYRGRDEVWFSSDKAGRRKVSIASMVAVSDSNNVILARLKENKKEQDRLAEAFRRDAALLLRVELPKNGDGSD